MKKENHKYVSKTKDISISNSIIKLIIFTIFLIILNNLLMINKNIQFNLIYLLMQIGLITNILMIIFRHVRGNPSFIISPLMMFLLTYLIYHSIGPLIYLFGNNSTILWMNNRYYVDAYSLHSVTLMTQVGLLCVLIGILIALNSKRIRTVKITEIENLVRKISIKEVITSLLFVGGLIKYLIILPYMMGITNITLPGSLYSFSNIIFIAIVLISYNYYKSNKKRMRYLLFVVLTIDLFSGFLIMSKLWIVLPIIAYIVGKYLAVRNLKSLIKQGVLIMLLFVILTPFILQMRGQSAENNPGSILESTIMAAFTSINNNTYTNSNNNELQWSWIRLNYVPAESFVMHMYDSGNPGDTIMPHLSTVLVPRMIYPEKPIFDAANKLSIMIDGNSRNNESAGIFAEAYWNYGWVGVIIISITIGIIYGRMDRFTRDIIKNKKWLLMPLVTNFFLVIGRGINGFFVDVFIAQFAFAIVQQIFIIIMAFFIVSIRRR